jgi:hypothetical protein
MQNERGGYEASKSGLKGAVEGLDGNGIGRRPIVFHTQNLLSPLFYCTESSSISFVVSCKRIRYPF